MSWMRTLGRVGVVSVVGFSMEDVLRKPMRRIAVAVIALALLSPLGADAQEIEVSANAGWVSQYFYRGGIVRLRVQVAQWTDEQPDTELSRLPIPA